MPRLNVPSRSRRRFGRALPSLRWSALPLAGCSNSAASTPIPSPPISRAPPQEITGSIAQRPATASARCSRSRCRRRADPRRSPPTAAAGTPAARRSRRLSPGSVRVTGLGARTAPPQPSGHWTWDGGSPVTVGSRRNRRDDRAQIRRAGFRADADQRHHAMPTAIRPGQRLVIPRYVSAQRRVMRAQRAACAGGRAAPGCRKRARRRARREPDRHCAPSRRDARRARRAPTISSPTPRSTSAIA